MIFSISKNIWVFHLPNPLNKGGSWASGPHPPNPSSFIFWGACICKHEYLYTFIEVNMKCIQYSFYSLLSVQKHKVCVKGHQTNPLTPRILPRPPVNSEIQWPATVIPSMTLKRGVERIKYFYAGTVCNCTCSDKGSSCSSPVLKGMRDRQAC